MNTQLSSGFPQALDDDDDDVSWALQTAHVQWTRGAYNDAIVWLHRAADSADRIGQVWRAADLRRNVQQLRAALANAPADSYPPSPLSNPSHEPVPGADDGEPAVIEITVSNSENAGPLPSYATVDDGEFEEEDDDSPFAYTPGLPGAMELFEDEVFEDEVLDHFTTGENATPHAAAVARAAREPDAPNVGGASPEYHPTPTREPSAGQHAVELADESVDELLTEPRVAAKAPPQIEADPSIRGVVLGAVRGLEDVPLSGQTELVNQAAIETLNQEEEVSSFGLALVVRGAVSVMPTIFDVSCARVNKGEIVWSRGHLQDGVALRLVAIEDRTEVAVWDESVLSRAVNDYPWVIDDLRSLSDRFQALAGASMGPMGERLDDAMRSIVTERCEVKRVLPGEELVTKGKPIGGMFIMAAGRVEIVDGDAVEGELGPGEFLFASQVLSGGFAPHSARGGKSGALLLFARRQVAHELLLSVPPLLEVFAS